MESVDLVVIGGGINGVGAAQYAAAEGYSVLLLEKAHIASQTSANSSKLIHGGLRYLESGQISLVKKSLHQRRELLKLAPELVKPVPFYIPIYDSSERGPWAIRAGLSLYALLSEFDPLGRFRQLPSVHWAKIKGLKLKGLKAVFQYWDAQTDDKLLTQAVAKSAIELGAKIEEGAVCTHIEHSEQACHIHYVNQLQEQRLISAKAVINASGPWVNQVLDKVSPSIAQVDIDWIQGTHLVLDITPPDGILYLESCYDKRVIFVIPWKGKTLVGTTEHQLNELPNKPEATQEEVDYLLGIYLHHFPQYQSSEELKRKLTGQYCGVRVLPKQDKNAFDRDRDTLIYSVSSHPRIVTIYGGKLTTFRCTAKESVDAVKTIVGTRQKQTNLNSELLIV